MMLCQEAVRPITISDPALIQSFEQAQDWVNVKTSAGKIIGAFKPQLIAK
jgi:hypothetical protein